MAIQVAGTNIITDAKALNGITSIDTTTKDAISAAGIGASTTYNDVGTYIIGAEDNGNTTEGTTVSGSSIQIGGFVSISGNIGADASANLYLTRGGSLSGTWRRMFRSNTGTTDYHGGLFVRIS